YAKRTSMSDAPVPLYARRPGLPADAGDHLHAVWAAVPDATEWRLHLLRRLPHERAGRRGGTAGHGLHAERPAVSDAPVPLHACRPGLPADAGDHLHAVRPAVPDATEWRLHVLRRLSYARADRSGGAG